MAACSACDDGACNPSFVDSAMKLCHERELLTVLLLSHSFEIGILAERERERENEITYMTYSLSNIDFTKKVAFCAVGTWHSATVLAATNAGSASLI